MCNANKGETVSEPSDVYVWYTNHPPYPFDHRDNKKHYFYRVDSETIASRLCELFLEKEESDGLHLRFGYALRESLSLDETILADESILEAKHDTGGYTGMWSKAKRWEEQLRSGLGLKSGKPSAGGPSSLTGGAIQSQSQPTAPDTVPVKLAPESSPAATGQGSRPTNGGVGRPTVKWQDVLGKLLVMCENNEPPKSMDDYASLFGCSPSTVHKAITKSLKLKAWRVLHTFASPRAQSINEVVRDNARSEVVDPADLLPDEDVDAEMNRLIQQAETPEKRAKLHALDKDERREVVRLELESNRDQWIEDKAVKGNRLLGRKP